MDKKVPFFVRDLKTERKYNDYRKLRKSKLYTFYKRMKTYKVKQYR